MNRNHGTSTARQIPRAFVLALALGGLVGTPLAQASPWTGLHSPTSGWTVVSDGTASRPQLAYSRGAPHTSAAYRFMTLATGTGTVTLPFKYEGHHSWFMAIAFVRPVIYRSGAYIYPAGYTFPPQSVPAPFSFESVVSFGVLANDEYGFEFGGSHFDSAYMLQGTFTVQIDPETAGVPGAVGVPTFQLYGNFPNPVTDRTVFRYEVPEAGEVDLSIYDVRGSRVATLESGVRSAGQHECVWVPGGLESGVYYSRISWGHQQRIHKLLISR